MSMRLGLAACLWGGAACLGCGLGAEGEAGSGIADATLEGAEGDAARDGGNADRDASHDGTPPPADAQGTGDTNDPGIRCGDAACPLTQTCLICSASATCVDNPQCTGGKLLNCDDRADCPGQRCCADMLTGASVRVRCTDLDASCGGELCNPAAANPCSTGGACGPLTGTLADSGYSMCQ
jgi:hypothetical protein